MSMQKPLQPARKKRPPGGPEPPHKESVVAPEEEQQRPRAWQVVRGGSALYRRYKFPDAAVADAFTRFVIAFASYSGLPLFVRLNDSEVTLALRARGGRRFSSTTSQLFDLTASLG